MADRLIAEHVTKRFGDLLALNDVSIEFIKGEIHAVLGENGAGKTTLMNVLSGFAQPQKGRVLINNLSVPLGQPHRCRKLGIEMVHQHFTLVPEFTVAENLALAKIDRLMAAANANDIAAPILKIAAELGWSCDANAKVRDLPVGVQQRIEILKCLSGNAEVLIFDEPTAVSTAEEVLDLFRVIRRLKDQGKIVILIAHKLSEVMAIADRVTVLRNGSKIATAAINEVDQQTLANWMVGEMPDFNKPQANDLDERTLEVSNLSVKGDRGEQAVKNVSLQVRSGEIFGIGGVDGNGQVELAEALALVRLSEGSLSWRGNPLSTAAIRIAYIPQDRQRDGLALGMTVRDNLLIEGYRRSDLRKGPFLLSKKIWEWAKQIIDRFDIRVSSPLQIAANLSGGNQQKIVVGRNLDQSPELLIAVNPTRGLDVRASQYIHSQLIRVKAEGGTVVLISTDLDELSLIADRTMFMSRGELVDAQGAESLVGGSP